VWIAFSLWTGFTFVGYFTPIRELFANTMQLSLGPWETFWVFFYGFATYGNAGFMREQVCKYMCPYARFQSAMFDDDTLIVTYDETRGEPRGGRNKKSTAENAALGSCVDCSLCVQVCPTGIDIRKGLQYECIGCGACADVCDTVMDKMGFERGLIKYSTQNAMQNNWTRQHIIQRVLRPRVLIYSAILALLVIGLSVSLYFKPSFRVDVLRDRAVMSRISADNKLENVYRLKVMNNSEQAQTYEIKVVGDEAFEVEFHEEKTQPIQEAKHQVLVNPGKDQSLVMEVKVADGTLRTGSHPLMFQVKSLETQESTSEKSVFIITQ
jgi:cytochrome c oxidase accessory protein FixG